MFDPAALVNINYSSPILNSNNVNNDAIRVNISELLIYKSTHFKGFFKRFTGVSCYIICFD